MSDRGLRRSPRVAQLKLHLKQVRIAYPHLDPTARERHSSVTALDLTAESLVPAV
jgi:hypothetical protein